MSHALRTSCAALAAGAVTASLFWLMQWLVDSDGEVVTATFATPVIEFRQIMPEPRTEPPPPRPVEPEPPEPLERPPELPRPDFDRPKLSPAALTYDARLPLDGLGPALSRGPGGESWLGGQLVPLVRITPTYPYRAALAEIEGWVRLEFTVTSSGAVTDPEVIGSRPPKIFDDAAMQAILKWRFQPLRVNGEATAVRVAQTIDFHLADN